MFNTPDQREDLVALLEARQASLWHACQLKDLRSYIALGGIPSRSLLEQRHLDFTGFVTDGSDRAVGVWDKVFLNLSDFGAAFAQGSRATPNPYGPIVFQVAPRALLSADEVAICLRSAGASGFDRGSETLTDCTEVDRLFRSPASVGFPRSADIHWRGELQAEFATDRPNAQVPEVSLGVRSGLVPLDTVVAVWVDPISIADLRLLDVVATAFAEVGVDVRVRPRYVRDEVRIRVFSDLGRLLLDEPIRLRLIPGRVDAAEGTRSWATGLLAADLEWQHDRFARYLVEGTLEPLRQTAADRSIGSNGCVGLIHRLEQDGWRVRPVVLSSDLSVIAATSPLGQPASFVVHQGRRAMARRDVEAAIQARRTSDLGWRSWTLVSDAGFSTDARLVADAEGLETTTVATRRATASPAGTVPGRA